MSLLQRLWPAADDDVGSFVIIISALAALNGLLFGFDTGVVSGALLYMSETFPRLGTDAFLTGTVVSGAMAGAIIGAAFGGRLADRLGRRRLILIGAILFFVGSFIMAVAPSVRILIVGRILDGVGIGFASVVGPLYIAEIAPAKIRGSLVTLNNVAITGGILLSYITNQYIASMAMDAGLSWRVMLGLGMIPAMVLFTGIIFMPESPRWLIEQDREQQARSVLSRIRNGANIDAEIQDILEMSQRDEGSFRDLLRPWLRPVLVVGLGLAILQQITGINAVVYYAPTILDAAGYSDIASLFGTIGIGLINVALTVVAVFLVDRVGRRPLLLVGLVGMFVSLTVLAVAYTLSGMGEILGPLTIASLMLFVAFHAVSLGSVVWLVISEIFPLNVRGAAMGVTTLVLWFANFLVAQFFPALFEVGETVAFGVFAGIAAVGFVFVYVFVPETKGRTLEEIEADLREASVGNREPAITDHVEQTDYSDYLDK
ncbi:putative metabolite transport protein YwtG [Haloarcula mannanilytica]|uniref:Putative metabolite transport protein YwtG n=1 Tax=Haloarcula mannanilytica TaxID=2509225 RepID=A0A4C2EP42_9EURY|nr:sugar porter family MFS transporter [Haloarcula mannanilytica]GCF16032.1 putative metabolite transport protein YwtG [Haloarcula mannanilytica]